VVPNDLALVLDHERDRWANCTVLARLRSYLWAIVSTSAPSGNRFWEFGGLHGIGDF